jgi:hypothetical protein
MRHLVHVRRISLTAISRRSMWQDEEDNNPHAFYDDSDAPTGNPSLNPSCQLCAARFQPALADLTIQMAISQPPRSPSLNPTLARSPTISVTTMKMNTANSSNRVSYHGKGAMMAEYNRSCTRTPTSRSSSLMLARAFMAASSNIAFAPG